MAPAGVINHITKVLHSILEELRHDIKTFVRNKAQMVRLLEDMIQNHRDNAKVAQEHKEEVRREAAKDRAL